MAATEPTCCGHGQRASESREAPQDIRTDFLPKSVFDCRKHATLLKSGEKREGINLQMGRDPSLCVEGKENGLAKQQKAQITLEHTDPGFGATRKGGSSFSFTWFDIVEAGRQFRICGLTDGTYFIRAQDFQEGQALPVTMFGETVVTLLGRDGKDADPEFRLLESMGYGYSQESGYPASRAI
ncbi:MAG: hypothetical protein KIT83_06275 [Bryobacterales bacterium]|nr:hypothetical protein [Bryobacterales bacterium]